jgi:Flp pilus assembly protein TadG
MRSVCSRRRQKGNTAIEFVLSFTVLWLMFSGVFTFGYTMYLYNGLLTQIGQGASYAARQDFDMRDPSTFQSVLKNVVVYGNAAGTGAPVVPGLTTSNVRITWTTVGSSSVPETVSVAIINYTSNAVFQSFTFNDKPKATVRYVGNVK